MGGRAAIGVVVGLLWVIMMLTPVPLMELTTGFWRFKVLSAGVELGLFSLLSRTGGADAA